MELKQTVLYLDVKECLIRSICFQPFYVIKIKIKLFSHCCLISNIVGNDFTETERLESINKYYGNMLVKAKTIQIVLQQRFPLKT